MAKMPMSRVVGAFAAVALSFISSAAAGDVWKSVADGSQPPVYMASDGTRISLRAEPLDGAMPRARLVAARSRIRAKNISSFPDSTDVSPPSLGDGDLRLYLRVTWEKDGAVRRAETYFSPALGDREPVRPEGMTAFDLDAFVAQCEAETQRSRSRLTCRTTDVPLSFLTTGMEGASGTSSTADGSRPEQTRWSGTDGARTAP